MAFMDKVKDMAGKAKSTMENAAQAGKEKYEQVKQENAEKKAQKEAYMAEMEAKAAEYGQSLCNMVMESGNATPESFMARIAENELLSFTKDFYEKMVLPGSKASISCIIMHPYIDEKKIKSIQKKLSAYDGTQTPILYINEADGQQFLMTRNYFYFKVCLAEDKKFYAQGMIECKYIDNIKIESEENECTLSVNEVAFATIKIRDTYKQDFITLNEYFKNIAEHDFEIVPEEIDRLIHEKIGDKIYQHIKKYMTYEDELVMYYAGGLDSLAAMDYIACTTKQIIIVNREMLGATSNVKQFYYEDITSMATEQNSKSDDLFVAVIDSALTAALKVCDLIIMVAGAKEKISTLYTIEAQRVVAIYHEYRKELKKGNQPTQTIIQQKEPDIIEQIEKLSKLRDSGIISEEEFNQKKASLLEKL